MALFFPLAPASGRLALGVAFLVSVSARVWNGIERHSRFDPVNWSMHGRWPKTAELMVRSSRFALRTIAAIALVCGLIVWVGLARVLL